MDQLEQVVFSKNQSYQSVVSDQRVCTTSDILNDLAKPLKPSLSKIAILLCTYNGQQYLSEQLNSIAEQSYSNWKVYVSDDNSNDTTYRILENYREKWGHNRLAIFSGPMKGFSANFLSLTCNTSIRADYFAYSDQDDIWESDKLQRAINYLSTISEDIPALYCSRTRLVNVSNDEIGFSPLFTEVPCFANALIQNIAGGNTMVFNQATRKLLCEVGDGIDVITHDWWVYMVVSGCGGKIFYDPYPSIRYRQHDNNLVGMNSTFLARCRRIRMLWQGYFQRWNDQNIQALKHLYTKFAPENQYIFECFSTGRKQSLLPRLVALKRSGIYRQTLLGNLGLFFAAIFKKV